MPQEVLRKRLDTLDSIEVLKPPNDIEVKTVNY